MAEKEEKYIIEPKETDTKADYSLQQEYYERCIEEQAEMDEALLWGI